MKPQTYQRLTRPSLPLRICWGDLLLARLLPAGVFELLLLLRVTALVRRLQAGAGDASPFSFWVLMTQQALAILFVALIVALFLIRRPVVGRHSSTLAKVVAVAGTLAPIVPVAARVAEDNTALLLLSAALVIAGISFSVISLLTLGRCFGITPEVRGLVTRGPYRWVRHPLYLGEIISMLGVVVATASLPMLGLFILFCGLQYWRTALEEHALEDAFSEYADYRRHTYRLLPWVY